MSEYKIGKDIQKLEDRISKLESELSISNDADRSEEALEFMIAEIDAPDDVLEEQKLEKLTVQCKVSLNRRCWREFPLNKAYSSWAAKCWSQNKDTGEPYPCDWIKLRYDFGSKDGATTNVVTHTRNKVRHCHGATLNGTFSLWGKEITVTTRL